MRLFKEAKLIVIDNWERLYIAQLFEHTRGNMTEASKVAGLSRAHLYRLSIKYQIKIESFRTVP